MHRKSEILDPNGPGILGPFLPKHEVGISFGVNYEPTVFSEAICSPCWVDASQRLGFAPIPTSAGQAPGVGSTLSGWGLVMNANSKNEDGARKAFSLIMSKDLLLQQDNEGGLVSPISSYNAELIYANWAPDTICRSDASFDCHAVGGGFQSVGIGAGAGN